jgi:hypothetical protein
VHELNSRLRFLINRLSTNGQIDRLNNSEDRSRFPVTRDSLLSALRSEQSVNEELAKSCSVVSGVNSLCRTELVSRRADVLLFQWGSYSGPRFNLAEVAALFVTPHPTPTSIGVAIEEGAVPCPNPVPAVVSKRALDTQ